MTGVELIATIGGSGLIVVILSLVKIKPLEISVWHWLARKLGRAFNGETLDRLTGIERTLEAHLKEEEERDIISYRTRILRFADEMYEKKYHSKEHFEETMDLIKKYNTYCKEHPEFENERTIIAQQLIKDQYEECMKRNSFELHTEGATNERHGYILPGSR